MRGNVYFLAGDGTGAFGDPLEVFTGVGMFYSLEGPDLNNDGRPDLVWGDVLNKEIEIAYQQ